MTDDNEAGQTGNASQTPALQPTKLPDPPTHTEVDLTKSLTLPIETREYKGSGES